MNDPIFKVLVLLSVRHRWTILACVSISTVAGFAMGQAKPEGLRANVLVQPAIIKPHRPAKIVKASRTSVANHLEKMKLENKLGGDVQIAVSVLKNQPPNVVDLPLLEIIATGRDEKELRRALQMGIDHLHADNPLHSQERVRLEAQMSTLRADLDRLHQMPVTPQTQDAKLKITFELSELSRTLSPARTHPARVLQPPRVRPYRAQPPLAVFVLAGAIVGLFFGYAAAFFIAGARALNKKR